ncbi:zf-HC2 domain-containing protein [Ruminococcus flavefaciens]|uniref:zf-HC2 domain-containing protein n=1 Tax=Ruminococcus flavefaciens TaxID=1265 RepID=UPI0026EE6C47|nr:zf-HC2 domain-containing protein [Ruminococcus flavefaciens]
MKNTIECNVIVDLLPLYKEEICSEETKILVEEHLAECADCRRLSEQVTIPEVGKKEAPTETETFKKVGKKLKRGRFYRRVLIFLFAAFAAVNVAWLKLKFFPFKDCAFGMVEYDYDEFKLCQEINVDYDYNVIMPNYLEFWGGTLYLWKSKNYNDNNVKELRIYPKIIRDNIYAVTINDGNRSYSIAITKELEFDPSAYKAHDNDEKMKKLLEENRDEIEELMQAAQNKWGDYIK